MTPALTNSPPRPRTTTTATRPVCVANQGPRRRRARSRSRLRLWPRTSKATVDQESGITAIVDDQLRSLAAGPDERAVGAVPVVLERLALPGEDARAVGSDTGGGVVLRAVDVARAPAHVGTESLERLDQDGGLDRHVQRAHDADALERTRVVLGTRRHQAGHLVLGERDLLATKVSEREVSDGKVLATLDLDAVVGERHANRGLATRCKGDGDGLGGHWVLGRGVRWRVCNTRGASTNKKLGARVRPSER